MNMNDINATGIYTLAGNWTNSPRGADSFVATGLLLHMHRRHNAGPISWQLCVLQTYENIVFYRFNNGGYWSTWFKMAQDDEVVHKTGDEEIAGQKTLQNRLVFKTVNDVLKIIHPSMDGTTIPDTSLFSHISFFDKNDNRQAFIQLADRPNGNLELELVLNNGSSDVVKDERIKLGYNKSTKSFYTVAPTPVTESNDNSIATTAWSVGKTGNRGNLSGFETPVVQSSALTVTNTSRDTNLVTGAVKITVNDGAANQAWTKTVAISNGSATIALGSKWKWYGGAAPDVSANCVLVLHWCSTFGVASLIVTA